MTASREGLDSFGKLLAEAVRDPTIRQWDKLVAGSLKGVTADRLRAQIDALGEDERRLLERLIPQIVDTALHHLLWSLEQPGPVEVSVRTPEGVVASLREVSDGLAGELYDWIPRFSKERYEAP